MGVYKQAIQQLAPDARFSFNSNIENYESLVWKDESTPPSKDSVEELVNELKPAWDKWASDRKDAYPSIEEQLDMLWRSMDNGEIPGKGSRWHEHIRQVKANTPKPE